MTNVQKFNMLIAFQKMFAQMQALDARYTRYVHVKILQ